MPELSHDAAERVAISETRWKYGIELVKTLFAGLKDLALVGVSLYTIQVQYENSGKLDSVTDKTATVLAEAVEVKTALHESAKERREQMSSLEAKIDASPMGVAAQAK